jgi:hypothetical protein
MWTCLAMLPWQLTSFIHTDVSVAATYLRITRSPSTLELQLTIINCCELGGNIVLPTIALGVLIGNKQSPWPLARKRTILTDDSHL